MTITVDNEIVPEIVRPRLRFEREFGQHRNWWVRDPRLVGRPLSVLLYLLSHDTAHMPTQTEAYTHLGMSKGAWRAAKSVLRECGFLLEVRDVYPTGQRRGQRRYRLVLLDPEPGQTVSEEGSLIVSERPVNIDSLLRLLESGADISDATGNKTPDRAQGQKMTPAVDNFEAQTKTPDQLEGQKMTLDTSPGSKNDPPYKEKKTRRDISLPPLETYAVSARETAGGMDGGTEENNQPTSTAHTTGHTRAKARMDVGEELNRELKAIHPSLSIFALQSELRFRLDLDGINLLAACRDILGAALARGIEVRYPPSYVAASLLRQPERWLHSATPLRPTSRYEQAKHRELAEREDCRQGRHDWGPEHWPEELRGMCRRTWCDKRRADLDPEYAAWRAKHDKAEQDESCAAGRHIDLADTGTCDNCGTPRGNAPRYSAGAFTTSPIYQGIPSI